MVRFLHTADWQLGAKLAFLKEKAEDARETRLETVRRVMKLAKELDVDFVVIAGDLFEDHSVGSSVIREVVSLFHDPTLPVFVLPGNHDPLVPGGIWDRANWNDRPSNIHFLDKREPIPVIAREDVLLYPCPLEQKASNLDPTAWIPKRDQQTQDAIRIGVAHGSLNIWNKDVNFPIPPDRAVVSELDYLALGDWHSYFSHRDRTYYSGTPEPTGFEEKGAGKVLEVEIGGPGQIPKVTRHDVAALTWEQQEYDVAGKDDLEELLRRADELKAPERTLWRVKLKGVADLDAISIIGEIEALLKERLYFLDLDSKGLKPAVSPEQLEALIPAGPVGEAAQDLLALSQGKIRNEIAQKYANVDPSVVQRALQLLYGLVKEGSA